MNNLKSHFKFNKQERSGIFFLLLIILLLQVTYFIFRSFSLGESKNRFAHDMETQAKIDLLKERDLHKDSIKIYPFNPNFITDYKGYSLGMSVEEIDRLHVFRATGKYVNSSNGFQEVTQISDSLLNVISSYFKFPAWAKKRSQNRVESERPFNNGQSIMSSNKVKVRDLNVATVEELKSISGIGEKLAARIIKFRDKLGGFLLAEQLYDVYGLSPEVVQRTLKRFKVINPPQIEKININTASVESLTKLIYLQKNMAIDIVLYRNSKKRIHSFAELLEIESFPKEKIDRITLYLSL